MSADLIARLEAATGPDRDLDAAIWLETTPGATRKATLVNHHAGPYTIDETRDATGRLITVPAYSASLDAAVSLMPETANTHGYTFNPIDGAMAYVSRNYTKEGHWLAEGEHKTSVAIALCIAALKARQP